MRRIIPEMWKQVAVTKQVEKQITFLAPKSLDPAQ
jgi:hypothetical protein